MPLYEYLCRECNAAFEALVPAQRRDDGAACPHCGADRIARKLSLIAHPVVKDGRSGGSAEPLSCGAPSCCGGACGLDD